MINTRKEVVKLLNKTFSENSYSNILLDSVLSSKEVSADEGRFITALYYGVLERKITLDHIISGYSSKKLSKLDDTVLNILRTGVFQLKYMDSVPDNAAVNESVKLTKGFRLASASGFVNAVLRNFIRDKMKIKEPDNMTDKLSVRYSVNPDIIKMLTADYGIEKTETFLKRTLEKTPVYFRLNNVKSNIDEIRDLAGKTEITENDLIPYCCEAKSGNIIHTKAFKKGLLHIQDIASQTSCFILEPRPTDTVLDLCSAPGGKAFTAAEIMNGKGRVLAFDIYEQRVGLISDGAVRLGLENISASVGDAAIHDPKLEGADRVICDVPCSGIGVMRKKPEIRYKDTAEFDGLPEIQMKILENAASYLKKGGVLVYSTCTLNKKENDEVIDAFLENHKDFEGVPVKSIAGEITDGYKMTLGFGELNSDGFFIARIRRKEL